MHKIVRFSKGTETGYGLVENGSVYELVGGLHAPLVPGSCVAPYDELTPLRPCQPTKIVGVGYNYRGHCQEVGADVPSRPVLYFKPPSAVVGPLDDIVYPPISNEVVFGGELAVVIGRRAHCVSTPEAQTYILGYTVGVDVTARDIRKLDGRNTRAKGFDTFCPLGPCIVTGLDADQFVIRTRIRGQDWREAADQEMLFGVPYLVSYISQVMTLEPGDVILTGEAMGGGTLAVGDVVEAEIEGIGTLINKVVRRSEGHPSRCDG